jgi:hypothetical protein
MIDKVGETAGRIWQYLSEHGETTGLKLKTNLKLTNSMVYMGVGWLSREDKVLVKDAKKDYKISLK